jgi:hypothetical protein
MTLGQALWVQSSQHPCDLAIIPIAETDNVDIQKPDASTAKM